MKRTGGCFVCSDLRSGSARYGFILRYMPTSLILAYELLQQSHGIRCSRIYVWRGNKRWARRHRSVLDALTKRDSTGPDLTSSSPDLSCNIEDLTELIALPAGKFDRQAYSASVSVKSVFEV